MMPPRVTRGRLPTLLGAGLLVLALLAGARAAGGGPSGLAAREQAVAASLRCPTCQGLSVAQSPSQIAGGMRLLIDSQLRSGRTPGQVREFFVRRYSTWILLSPATRGLGGLIWFLPAAGLLLGAILAANVLRRRAPPTRAANAAAAVPVAGRVSRADQLEAAHMLLAAVKEDFAAGQGDPEALRRANLAWRTAQALPPDPDPAPSSTPAPSRRGRSARRRRAAAVLVGTGSLGLVVALLLTSVAGRGAGALPTGTLAGLTPLTAGSSSSNPPAAVLQARAAAHPRQVAGWLNAGQALDAEGELVAAYQDFQRALTLAPADATAERLAASALLQGGSPGEALPLASRAAAAQPMDPRAVLLLGMVDLALGHRRAAHMEFTRFLSVQPDGAAAAAVRSLQARS